MKNAVSEYHKKRAEHNPAPIYTSPEEAEILAGDALSSQFPFTLFPDTKARTKRGKRADLIALAKRVQRTVAAEKNALPLVSLCRYGDLKSENGSLRHRENLREVHGLEADYDAGEMPPAEAARRFAEARIAVLIHTSPSHGQPGKGHRWRVLCPFSGPLHPEERERHVARLNGVLGGVLASESFDLSRSYFIGGIEGKEPETFLVDGEHIDGRADLDAGAIHARTSEPKGKPVNIDMVASAPADRCETAREWFEADCAAFAEMEAGEPGGRHKGLYVLACHAGSYGAAGLLGRAEINAMVADAAAANGYLGNADESEFRRVLKDGLREGSREPAEWPVSIAEDFDDLSEADSPPPPAKVGWGAPMMRGDRLIINLHNTTRTLGRDLDTILPGLALNLMSGREEWNGGEVDDATVSLTRVALERKGLDTVGSALVSEAINLVARKNQRHPIRDYLDGLTWDGTARLDDWLLRHVGAEDSPYVRAVGRKFLISMVARVMQPGCKVDHTLVLSGAQGLGKSTLCHVLAGDEYFTDSMPSITKGDQIEATRHVAGKWLVEMAELAAMFKADAEVLKGFLSRSTDRVRRPFQTRDAPYPRQCVFVGTTNEEQFLQDATGGRRFWPVTVTKRIDMAALSAERDQLFAEALTAYRDGELWHLDPAFEAQHAKPVQEAARVSDSWAEKIAAWLDAGEDDDFREDGEAVVPRTGVRLSDVLQDALAISPAQHSRANQNRAAAIMRDLGWTKSKTRTGSVWRSPELQESGA